MQPCNIYVYLQFLSVALLTFLELSVGAEEEVSMTVGNIALLSCLIPGQLPYNRPVSWYWTPQYPECSSYNGGKVVDIYPDGRIVFEEEFKGRVLVFRSKIKKGDYSITLRGVKIPDSGEFICTHDHLSEQKKVKLIVKTGCWSNLHLTVDPPVVSVGDKVTLTCTYCGSKALSPRIKWQYDGLSISNTGVVSITNDGQSLVISHVDQEHLKRYGCSLAKKESIVSEICLNIEFDFLDTTFAVDYDYLASTAVPIITHEATTALTTPETTTQVKTMSATTNSSQNVWNDLEWMQDTSPEPASLRTESYPSTIQSTVKTAETSDPWNEEANQDQLGLGGRDCPVVIANDGTDHLPLYICIVLGGILLLLIIVLLIKRFKGHCKHGTHDVEQNTSGPNNRNSLDSEGNPPETQDESLVQTGNEDDNIGVTVDGVDEEMQERKDEDEDTTEPEVQEVGVGDSKHANESEDMNSQGEDQE